MSDGWWRSGAFMGAAASVTSALPPLPPGEIIYGLRPPAQVPFDWVALLIQVFFFWLAVWVIFRITMMRKTRVGETSDAQSKPPVDFRLEALASLDRLKSSPVWRDGRTKDACEALSGILKSFLHGCYSLGQGAAATSDELTADLRKKRVPDSLLSETVALLGRCDEVKYAHGTLGTMTFDELWSRYKSLVVREDWRR